MNGVTRRPNKFEKWILIKTDFVMFSLAFIVGNNKQGFLEVLQKHKRVMKWLFY